jgi:U3 small nucleolar RNA-associated protein 15
MSCSDDTTVRLWDLPSDQSVWTGWGHQDYVRSGAYIGDAHLLVTGSYDRSIRIWDTRISSGSSQACVINFKLSSPVESVLPLPNGTTLVGASAEKITILDLVAAKPLQTLHNHQKTVTAMSLATRGTRLLTGALDGHVKVFDTTSWSVVAGYKFPSPILSLAVVPTGAARDDKHLCVGMQSGLLSIRTRLSSAARAAKRERDKEMGALMEGTIEQFDRKKARKERKRGAGWSARIRGKDYTGEGADIVIDTKGATKSGALRNSNREWEVLLRKTSYARSLDAVLATRERTQILTLLTALIHRSALPTALANRSAASLLPLLRWLQKHIADPRCTKLTVEVALVLVEEYAEFVGQSEEFDAAVERLLGEVRRGVEMGQMAVSTVGMLDLLGAGDG